nr:monodehydroascorbate reductase [Tanacetum cinerariifolium]
MLYLRALAQSLTIHTTCSFVYVYECAESMANAPVRPDEQILPHDRWIAIGKSNCYLNEERSQLSPIYKIAVDILKQTNFFRAFTASSTIPTIYIQQFWDTIYFDIKAFCYRCQLDEQWYDLSSETLRDALEITPVDNNRAFTNPPSSDTLIHFVNELGYPKEVKQLSNVITNDMFQPWRAITTIINLCLTGKTSGFERPRAPVLQILWGIVNGVNIDYADRIWEELTQSIHIFLEDKKKMDQHSQGKKKATHILIPSIRFTKLIICHLQRVHHFHKRHGSPLHLPADEPVLGKLKFTAKGTKREVFGMPIPDILLNNAILGADYYQAYLKKVDVHQRSLAGEKTRASEPPAPKATKPTAAKQNKPIKSTKPTSTQHDKPKETKAAPKHSKAPPVKPLEKKRKPEKEATEEHPAKRSKRGKVTKIRSDKTVKRLVDEFKDEGVPAEKPRLEDTEDVVLQKVLEASKTDAYPSQRVIRSEYQEEDQAGSDPGKQAEGQAGPNPGVIPESLPLITPGVLAGPNPEHSEAEVETKVESIVSVTIQQDTSPIPPMTSPEINITA